VRANLAAGRRTAVCRAARAPTSPLPPGAIRALSRCFVRSNGSASRLAAFCLAGGPPGYGGDRRVSLVQRLRCPGGRVTALGGQSQAMHERPGQRQGDSQQQPYPQAPGEKCPHIRDPFVVPREVLWRYPPCPGLTSSRAALPLRSHMVTRVGEHCADFRNGFARCREDVPWIDLRHFRGKRHAGPCRSRTPASSSRRATARSSPSTGPKRRSARW
jgi:hypothetical protein